MGVRKNMSGVNRWGITHEFAQLLGGLVDQKKLQPVTLELVGVANLAAQVLHDGQIRHVAASHSSCRYSMHTAPLSRALKKEIP